MAPWGYPPPLLTCLGTLGAAETDLGCLYVADQHGNKQSFGNWEPCIAGFRAWKRTRYCMYIHRIPRGAPTILSRSTVVVSSPAKNLIQSISPKQDQEKSPRWWLAICLVQAGQIPLSALPLDAEHLSRDASRITLLHEAVDANLGHVALTSAENTNGPPPYVNTRCVGRFLLSPSGT